LAWYISLDPIDWTPVVTADTNTGSTSDTIGLCGMGAFTYSYDPSEMGRILYGADADLFDTYTGETRLNDDFSYDFHYKISRDESRSYISGFTYICDTTYGGYLHYVDVHIDSAIDIIETISVTSSIWENVVSIDNLPFDHNWGNIYIERKGIGNDGTNWIIGENPYDWELNQRQERYIPTSMMVSENFIAYYGFFYLFNPCYEYRDDWYTPSVYQPFSRICHAVEDTLILNNTVFKEDSLIQTMGDFPEKLAELIHDFMFSHSDDEYTYRNASYIGFSFLGLRFIKNDPRVEALKTF
jgi:hypothetical protein